jgi:hypothetical protein
MSVFFTIRPAYRDVEITVKRGANSIYELTALAVDDVRYQNDGGRETLAIALNAHETIWLTVKPRITVLHKLEAEV